jgi:hypothetical protein
MAENSDSSLAAPLSSGPAVLLGGDQEHPAAQLFPMMPDAELSELAEDIRKNGLLEPIILLGGMVLDGRNRLSACRRAGVEPRFEIAAEIASPTLYVVSKNIHRRHLTTSQRAAIAVEMLPMLADEAKARQREGGRRGGENKVMVSVPQPYSNNEPNELRGTSRDIAGRAVGVGGSSVERAAILQRDAPEEFERVKKGEVTVGAAWREATERKNPANKRQLIIENAAKQKMIVGMSQVRGLCRGLEELSADTLRSGCSAQELKSWASAALECAKRLRAFAQKLKEDSSSEAA